MSKVLGWSSRAPEFPLSPLTGVKLPSGLWGRSAAYDPNQKPQGRRKRCRTAALHKSMLAYSGQYRVEGGDFITTVDVSWNESWNGSEQRRHYRIEGDKLFIDSAPAPSITSPGKTDYRRIVWERER